MSSNEPSIEEEVNIEDISDKAETKHDSETKDDSEPFFNSESSSYKNKFLELLDVDKFKIIFDAIVKKIPKIEDILKNYEWDVEATNSDLNHFNLLLKHAIKKGLAEIVDKILSFDFDMDRFQDSLPEQSPINYAIEIHDLKIVKILLKRNFSKN